MIKNIINRLFGGPPKLSSCIKANDVQGLKKLLDEGVDPNTKDSNGDEPIWQVVIHYHNNPSLESEKILELLLLSKANQNVKEKRIQKSPLFFATERSHTSVVNILLKYGADANIQDKEGKTPLMGAAAIDSIEICDLLLSKGALINLVDKKVGYAPLTYAINNNGSLEMVKLLVKNGADICHVSFEGGTAFSNAVVKGKKDIVEYLLGILNNKVPQNKEERCPLFSAVVKNDAVIAELLLKNGADPNFFNRYSVNPLRHAIDKGYVEMAKLLIKYGGKTVINPYGESGIHNAFERNDIKMVITLLQIDKPDMKLLWDKMKNLYDPILDNTVLQHIIELIDINSKFSFIGKPQADIFDGNNCNIKARQIGERLRSIGNSRLYVKGGHSLMLIAHDFIKAECGTESAKMLESAWNGIGDWSG